jgi:hypothetical protein
MNQCSDGASPFSDGASPFSDGASPYVTPIQAPPARGPSVLATLCIIGGILGLMMGLFGILQLFLADQFSTMFTPTGNSPEAQVQQRFQAEVQAVTDRFLIPNILSMLALLTLGGSMLVGGIGMLQRLPWAGTLLRRVFVFGIVFELGRMLLQGLIQWNMAPVMQQFMRDLQSSANNGPGGEFMGTAATIGAVVGVIFAVFWGLAKIGLYIWGYVYLGRYAAKNQE